MVVKLVLHLRPEQRNRFSKKIGDILKPETKENKKVVISTTITPSKLIEELEKFNRPTFSYKDYFDPKPDPDEKKKILMNFLPQCWRGWKKDPDFKYLEKYYQLEVEKDILDYLDDFQQIDKREIVWYFRESDMTCNWFYARYLQYDLVNHWVNKLSSNEWENLLKICRFLEQIASRTKRGRTGSVCGYLTKLYKNAKKKENLQLNIEKFAFLCNYLDYSEEDLKESIEKSNLINFEPKLIIK